MRVKGVIDEDFANYKTPSMFISTISCGGKCCTEQGLPLSICQNDTLREAITIPIPDENLIRRYLGNPITHAIVFGGLEPFEQFEEVFNFVSLLRTTYRCNDDVVVYTGYNRNEVEDKVRALAMFPNIIIKFGRYIPDRPPRFDDVLGVTLTGDNQYAERIS